MVNWLGEIRIIVEADTEKEAERDMNRLVIEIRRLMSLRGIVGHVLPERVIKEEDFGKEE
ncbi:MAG: hypothetical protein GXP63_02370 [DPANN group archaeon]|nr:hypothetical protein [DPANN group archaeon]